MALDKAIQSGKEHRKPWVGRDRSKNFDGTCRNRYCKCNRLISQTRELQKAEEKMKDMDSEAVHQDLGEDSL